MKNSMIKVSREWLGTALPATLETVLKGFQQPEWYVENFGQTPQKGLENIIEGLKQQARQAIA
jgi:hypothetical protein